MRVVQLPTKWELRQSDADDSTTGGIFSELLIKMQVRRFHETYVWSALNSFDPFFHAKC